MSIKLISDTLLLEAYQKAIAQKLDSDFIYILKEELRRRGLLPD